MDFTAIYSYPKNIRMTCNHCVILIKVIHMTENILALGIDLGTTSISAAVTDITAGTQLEFFTVEHMADMECAHPAFHEQDARLICEKALTLIDSVMDKYPDIRAIGLTGQMHGIVYLDINGGILSNLINWQDKRGDIPTEEGPSHCEYMRRITGMHIATGYGLASHFYNLQNSLVPENAATFASIMDVLGMRLTGRRAPLIHNSVAASFGLFDNVTGAFVHLDSLGITGISIPEVTDDYALLGTYRGAQVSVAIGDNQASILGSVKDIDSSVLINIGTGSQISMVTDALTATDAIEIRPLTKGRFIACASALCGGNAYALLERFFREYTSAGSQYDRLNSMLEKAYMSGIQPLAVDTSFMGKRHDPAAAGSITGITFENFTPAAMALGFINGMCRELYSHFEGRMTGKKYVVASGNAVQKIPVFRSVAADMFGMPVMISENREEASLGAALFACVACGILKETELAGFINYREM